MKILFAVFFVYCAIIWHLIRGKRSITHFIVFFIVTVVVSGTCSIAMTHYREVNFLRRLSPNDLVSVSVEGRPRITDQEQLQKVVAGLRSPEDFLASRDNHGSVVRLTLGLKSGLQKDFEISRAEESPGAVLTIRGGHSVLYPDLEWLLPQPHRNRVSGGNHDQ